MEMRKRVEKIKLEGERVKRRFDPFFFFLLTSDACEPKWLLFMAETREIISADRGGTCLWGTTQWLRVFFGSLKTEWVFTQSLH